MMDIVSNMRSVGRAVFLTAAVAALAFVTLGAPGMPFAPDDTLERTGALGRPNATTATYASLGEEATGALVRLYYDERGVWRDCARADCRAHNNDWGSDSLTNALYLRYTTTHDERALPKLAALARTARRYPAPCAGKSCLLWSDAPLWDSVAASREYEALPSDSEALEKARAAFDAVENSPAYDVGACPSIRYQRPYGRGDRLKTLETDSNGVKAALLLYDATHASRYLTIARTRYAAIRRYYYEPDTGLYSVYVFDDGAHCTRVPQRYFASVNGNMIWNGVRLYELDHDPHYLAQADGTALAIDERLADGAGIFTDLQAENDLEEPLVEAMLALATREHREYARAWIVRNAAAAVAARRADGSYGRFFDGPPPPGDVTAWQTSGALALEIAAAALAPSGHPDAGSWDAARSVAHDVTGLPATIHFSGSGIALVGTIGEHCCQPGHARIFVDGVETANHVGTWQNKSSSGRQLPGSILFAWRFSRAGDHVVTLAPGVYNAKEGGSFIHLRGYLVR